MLMVHVDTAAAQFDLEASIRRNKLETYTSVSCLRVKRKKIHRKCFSNGRCSISKIRIWKNSCGLSKTLDFNPLCSDNLTQSFDINRSFIILCWKLLLYVQLCSLWQNTQCRQKGRKNSWTRLHQLTLIMSKLQNMQKELKNQLTYYFIAQNKILKVCQILYMSNVKYLFGIFTSFKVCY